MRFLEEPEIQEILPNFDNSDQNSQKFEKFKSIRGENNLGRNEESRKQLGNHKYDNNLNDRYQRPGPSEYYRLRSYAPT